MKFLIKASLFECESLSSTVLNMLLLQGSSACIQTVMWLFHYKRTEKIKLIFIKIYQIYNDITFLCYYGELC